MSIKNGRHMFITSSESVMGSKGSRTSMIVMGFCHYRIKLLLTLSCFADVNWMEYASTGLTVPVVLMNSGWVWFMPEYWPSLSSQWLIILCRASISPISSSLYIIFGCRYYSCVFLGFWTILCCLFICHAFISAPQLDLSLILWNLYKSL